MRPQDWDAQLGRDTLEMTRGPHKHLSHACCCPLLLLQPHSRAAPAHSQLHPPVTRARHAHATHCGARCCASAPVPPPPPGQPPALDSPLMVPGQPGRARA